MQPIRARQIPPPRSGRRALTMVELMVTLVLASLLFSSVVGTFIALSRTAKEMENTTLAAANGRAAVETISKEVKVASNQFLGTNVALDHGDRLDNDGDDRIDEEQPDGLDQDGDWADMHAATNATLYERTSGRGRVDYGDQGVDEDCLFNTDRLAFRIDAPTSDTYQYGNADFLSEDIAYEVREFEGEQRVLVRSSTRLYDDGRAPLATQAPLAYDVLSFNCLYWDSNAPAANQYWRQEWDYSNPSLTSFTLPASVLVEVTVHADRRSMDSYAPGQPVRTLTLRSIVNIEEVIADAQFSRMPAP